MLELSILKNYRDRLTVHSVSGVIELNDQILSILTISSTSGNVDLDQVQTGSFKMKTTSGDFSADGLLSEKSELSSVSGDIKMLSIKGGLAVKTTSGKISGKFPIRLSGGTPAKAGTRSAVMWEASPIPP